MKAVIMKKFGTTTCN